MVSALDKGIHGQNTTVRSIVSDGNGSIYVSGHFPKVNQDNVAAGTGGINVNHIAKWNGSNWSELGSGMTDLVYNNSTYSGLPWVRTLCYDYENQTLYAGGGFLKAGGINARNIAKWDGTNWSSMAGGFEKEVYAICKNGANLYVGGQFLADFANSNPNNRHVSNWNGSMWTALGTGVGQESVTQAVLTISADNGNNVFFGGTFYDVASYTGPNGIRRFTHWRESVLKIDEITNTILIYPNPTKDELNVNGLMKGNKLIVSDLMGRIVFSTSINSSSEKIQLGDLQNGEYLILIQTERANFIEKLSIQ
jgi:hypothetical protein